jgi:membrane glycosyltransferase
MNKITKYIDALPLSDAEKSALPDTSLQAVHQALDDEHQTFAREDDSPLGSVKARLAHSWPDSLAGDQLVKDDEGRTQLHAMPKAKRAPRCSRTRGVPTRSAASGIVCADAMSRRAISPA